MVTLSKELDSPSGLDQKEGSIVKKTETCVGDDGGRPDIPPTNHIHISKHEAPVNGRFILDLSLWPPPPPPGVASNTPRKNVILHTTGGPVTAEMWIKPNESTNLVDMVRSKRVSLDLCSDNGPVRAIVHDLFSPDKSSRVFPFINMNIRSNHGDVYLSLPRCFRGPITICTGDDRIAFSPAFEKCTVLTSDVQGVRVYFVGDRPRGGKWGISGSSGTVEDLLDEILVDGRHTSVRINWEGESDVPAMVPNPWQALVSGAERFFATGRLF